MAYVGPRGIPLSTFLSWRQSDQDAALAWASHESRRCSSCGHHPDEGEPHAHVTVCRGCQATQALAGDGDVKGLQGAHVRLARGAAQECQRCRTEAEMNA